MEIMFFWLLFSIAVGVLAFNRGRSGFGWFVLSMFISPLLGVVFCLVSRNLSGEAAKPSLATHVKCPACAELVLPEATKCKHCGSALTPRPDSLPEIFKERQDGETIRNWMSFAALAFIAVVAYLLSAS